MNLECLRNRVIPIYLSNIFIDSCAFDPKYEPENQATEVLFQLYDIKDNFNLEITHSVQKEIGHPNTPAWVKKRARSMIYTIEVTLTEEERRIFQQILTILAGNGKVENIFDDAVHIFEAQKYGPYFITTDKRLLSKSDEIRQLCSLFILKPSELVEILNSY